MRRPRRLSVAFAVRVAVVAVAITSGGLACSRTTLPAANALGATKSDRAGGDTPIIGLQRGGRWSVISIRPPHLSGPQFHLQLRNSVLTGAVSGGTAPSGNLRVNIKEDGAEGFGPLGPVSLDFATDEQATTAEGTWNGGRVHLVFARESLRGTVTTNSLFHNRAEGGTSTQPENIRRTRRLGRAADLFEPPAGDLSCEYFLDELSVDGALNGGSTCAGMPQQTRLEVPSLAKTWLTHAELVTILVAVLSAPPVTVSDDPFRR